MSESRKYFIFRYINGVVLNPREFVLTTTGRVKWFKSYTNARIFLLKKGIKPEHIDNGIYIVSECF